jgi:biopolymer transport protein ExbD
VTLRNVEYILLWSDVVQRGIYTVLALMLAYSVFVLLRFLRRSRTARLENHDLGTESTRDHILKTRDLLSDLSRGLWNLEAISFAAPFLGLTGTSYGILVDFYRLSTSSGSGIVFLLREMPATFITAAAGILVAVPAVVVHNSLRSRVENLRRELLVREEPQSPTDRPFRRAQTLPLRQRFSDFPPYPLIAVPVFTVVVIVNMVLRPLTPMGLPVHVALDHCESGMPDATLVLRITNDGTPFINKEQETWDKLAGRLAEIYRMRVDRTLYVQADDDVRFQTVADAIDIARRATTSPPLPTLTVRLMTPQTQAMNPRCHAPLWTPKLSSPK